MPRGADRVHQFYFFDPPYNLKRFDEPFPADSTSPPGEDRPLAWVQISAKLESDVVETVQLTIDDGKTLTVPSICAFRMPLGTHTIRVDARGYRKFEREIELESVELCMLSFEMDPEDAEMHTILLYSVADYDVQQGLVKKEGFKVMCEPGQEPGNLGHFVHKTYWAPLVDYEPGSALVKVELPFESPSDIELEFCTRTTASRGWSVVEAGVAPDSLSPIWVVGPGDLPPSLGAAFPVDRPREPTHVHTWRGSEEAVRSDLVAQLRGSRTLYLRFWAGGVPGGDSVSTASALRCNALPTGMGVGQPIDWEPAVRIRVR